jgi:hypothetical protein
MKYFIQLSMILAMLKILGNILYVKFKMESFLTGKTLLDSVFIILLYFSMLKLNLVVSAYLLVGLNDIFRVVYCLK